MYKELTHYASAPLIYLLSRKVTIVTGMNSICEFSAYANDSALSDATLTQERVPFRKAFAQLFLKSAFFLKRLYSFRKIIEFPSFGSSRCR